jgi:hypothetical protein
MLPSRSLPLALALAVALAWSAAATAEEAVFDDCKVVKIEGMKLRITGPSGQEHAAEVAADAKVTVDGKAAKLGDLKAGMKVKLTVRKGDGSPLILKVEGTTK